MLSAAVIGCGRMGAEPAERLEGLVPVGWLPMSHAECLERTNGVELVALADTDSARLEHCGKRYGVQALYSDYSRLLDEVRPDIVTVATRTPGKTDIIQDACARGVRGLYVEKPLANSLVDCKKALAAAEAGGVAVGYGVNRRYHAVYRHARQLVTDGEIGDVVELTAEFGEAQLLWTHPHVVDLFLFFLGTTRVSDVQAWLIDDTVDRKSDRLIDSDPVIESAHFSFESGVSATITKSGGCNLRIGGSKGSLTVHADGADLQLSRSRGAQLSYFVDQEFVQTPPGPSATIVAFEELLNGIEKGGAAPIAPAEIEVGMRMLFGCVWSHLKAGRRVSIDSVPTDLTVTGKYGELYA